MTGLLTANFNMAQYCIGAAASRRPDWPALLVYDDPGSPPSELWTFAEIERAVLNLASGLGVLGLAQGDRIAIHLGNSSASALLYFAAIAAGTIALPLSDQLTARELKFILENSGARVFATDRPDHRDVFPAGGFVIDSSAVARMIETPSHGRYAGTAADDPAFLVYTSGTTAEPKGVLHAHRSAWGRRPMYQDWYAITEADRVLHAGAFNWTFTLGTGLADPWANGATAIVYTGERAPDVWPGLIEHSRATIFAAVPGVFRQILKYAPPRPGSLGALRHGLIAGEAPPPGLFEAWERTTGCPLYEALGMSEISTYISSSPTVPRRDGFIGRAQSGREIAILPVDGGETPLPPDQVGLIGIARTDPGLMLRYWNRPDEDQAVTRGRWFVGGDIGCMTADGYIRHLGRSNDIMNAGGYRVSPLEIEAVLGQAPGAGEVACTEVSVRDGVSIIAAFVVRDETNQATVNSLNAYARTHLAPYKQPKEIVFVNALPRTANGKIKRSELAALAVCRPGL